MSSPTKKRSVGANFRKSEERSATQRSRPTSARSNASGRSNLSNSFRSEVSDISGLSVTGVKTAQNRPRSRPSTSVSASVDRSHGFTACQKKNQNDQSYNKPKSKTAKDEVTAGKVIPNLDPIKNNLHSPTDDDPDKTFEEDKEVQWWENLPEEISFSPTSSLSFASSRVDNIIEKRKKNLIASSSVRSPSLNDFLDFPDETKTALENSAKTPENASKNGRYSPKTQENASKNGRYSSTSSLSKEAQRNPRNEVLSSKNTERNSRTNDEGLRGQNFEENLSSKSEHRSSKNERKSWSITSTPRNDDATPRNSGRNSKKNDEVFPETGGDNFEENEKISTTSSKSGQRQKQPKAAWEVADIPEIPRNEGNNFRKSENFQESFKIPEDEWSFENVKKLQPVADERVSEQEAKAALTIQRCYRGYKTRVDEGHSALQKVMEEKRSLRQLRQEEDYQNSEFLKQRRRDEKARLARLSAIGELNEKRAQKQDDNKRKAEQELKFLEESGKVTKAKNKGTGRKKENKKKSSSNEDVRSVKSATSDVRPGTANTLDSKVDELFEEPTPSTIQADVQQKPNESVSEANTSRTEKTAKTADTKTTLDDLFESLRQLEEEPTDMKTKEEKSDLYDWLEKSGSRTRGAEPGVSGSKLTQDALRNSTGNPNLLSQEKLRSIMSFLDEVEQTDQDTVVSRPKQRPKTFGEVSPSASMNTPRVDAEKELALLESASAAASDITNAMMSVKVELEEKKKTNELLQRALNQQREFGLRQARDMEKDAKQRLDLQRQEYESTIQRHLSFIDQLIDDKKILSERCEELVKKLKETDKKYVDKIQTMEESHATELKKQKDIMTTAEKLRREKWVKEKSQQIKELTVKGLEPDIQKLIAKHKAELKKLKSVHQAELLESDERAGRRYLHQIEELRGQLERDKETACNRERELAQTRFQKQMEEEEQSFQQQRRRLYSEIQEEKERVASQAQKQRKELDELKEKLEDAHKFAMTNVESTSKKSVDELEQRHASEMKELKERLEIEKQQWIENYMKKQDATLLQKERELKEGVRESRDKEIELVIRRLEEETALARDECERAAENRIKRVRDKYESEMKELEKSEKTMHEKYSMIKEQCNDREEEVVRLKSGLKSEERKMEDLAKLTTQLQEERGQVVDIIRQEFADRLVTTDEDNKRLKIEMSELRAKHRLEVERITSSKEGEMDEVHRRVKQAISKKEETLNSLRQQKESAEKRADHLEFLLQEQRKKLLS